MYSGAEHLEYMGRDLPYTMLQYWQTNLSTLLLNMTRGSFAEFIVNCALDAGGCDTLSEAKTGMEPYDIEGPEIPACGRSSRIEVKSSASIQLDTPDEKEPLRLPPGRIVFSIRKAVDWGNVEAGPKHNNDLYVFCHFTATRKSDNILDMKYWDFYVYPTFKIDEHKSLSKQNTISLARLIRLGVPKQSFDTLNRAILDTIDEISKHFSDKEIEIK